MSDFALLGIDLGTSSVKVILTSLSGRLLAASSREYPIAHPAPGHAEQDPALWWQAIVSAVHSAIGKTDRAVDVLAIGLSGQMHGIVMMGTYGQPLAPAIIWPDQRSSRQVEEITRRVGHKHLIDITGSPVATGFLAASALWIEEELPDLWDNVYQLLLPKDFIRYRLTGHYATDPSDGSGALLLDVNSRTWSDELLEFLEIAPELLPRVQESQSVAGTLSTAAAKELTLMPGIPVVTGAADTACSALGTGAVDAGSLLLTISTGGQLVLPISDVAVDRLGRIHTFCSALPSAPGQPGWYQMGAMLSAGMALRWLRDRILGMGGDDAYTRMTNWAAKAPVGANGLIFLPYLVGERTPHMNPNARGMFYGLTWQHGRDEFVRAVMEGVTFACFDGYQVLAELGARPERIILAGGGARSKLWQQMVADVFDLPVQPFHAADQSAKGSVLLAGAGHWRF
jgi:xylulokinase